MHPETIIRACGILFCYAISISIREYAVEYNSYITYLLYLWSLYGIGYSLITSIVTLTCTYNRTYTFIGIADGIMWFVTPLIVINTAIGSINLAPHESIGAVIAMYSVGVYLMFGLFYLNLGSLKKR